ncbi:YybH family protein [Nocardia terpenica]|uniref:DUF4440 domain-containing protein n=1 Tax=Nocardia terpenica TaxID=455432 RepID=A0A6G9Z2K6_9NOCA|nr:nuclear transport factor 2 family protein [Nocardia terpenica]QIS19597.1 DUF4440 domain-containing protein [Nocardia terpenica]
MDSGSTVDLDRVIEHYHRGIGIFMTGDHEPASRVLSRRGDVSLGNPFGPWVRGLPEVIAAMSRAAAQFRDGRALGFDRISEWVAADLASIVELERLESRVGGRPDVSPVNLRATSVFRREEDGWWLVHRHVDTTAAASTVEAVVSALLASGASAP